MLSYFIVFLISLIAAGTYAWFKKEYTWAQLKGMDGEKRVNDIIKSLDLPLFSDAYLPSRNGTTQIDHIVRAGNCIVVIETKNYDGTIYADTKSSKWTQFIRRKKSTFMSPIKQNNIHVNAVTKITGKKADIRPLVVMAGKAKFKNPMPDGVIKIGQLKQYLRLAFVDAGPYGTIKEPWKNIEETINSTKKRKAIADHSKTIERAKNRSKRKVQTDV